MSSSAAALSPRATTLALAVADANWFTTENLFVELDRPEVETLLLRCDDYLNAWRRGGRPPTWGKRLTHERPGLWRRELVLPSGWMKRFPALGMRPIRGAIRRWKRRAAPSAPLALVATYPYYRSLRDLLRPDFAVYYNIDDYSLYWPAHADRVRALERQFVAEVDLTVCVSAYRAEELRAAVPEAADKIRHLPHGAPSWSIPEVPHLVPGEPPADLAAFPAPRIGYVGSLEDRVDWPLLSRLADRLPHASIVLIGRPGEGPEGDWREARARCLERNNVHAIGWRAQTTINAYNAAFDINLIPYVVDHPFNRTCCPTKIMDAMGCGRPVVSTALPECRLHASRFEIAETDEAFLATVERLISSPPDPDGVQRRHQFARENRCEILSGLLVEWIEDGLRCRKPGVRGG